MRAPTKHEMSSKHELTRKHEVARVRERHDVLVTRVLDAPLAAAWQAWSDPREVARWWGPRGFIAPHVTSDFRIGGKYLFCMHGAGPDRVIRDYWNAGTYLEIMPMKKIIMNLTFADEHGSTAPASHYGLPGTWPEEMMLTATFDQEKGGQTRLALRQTGIPSEIVELITTGWNQSLDKFADVLSTLGKRGGDMEKHKLAA